MLNKQHQYDYDDRGDESGVQLENGWLHSPHPEDTRMLGLSCIYGMKAYCPCWSEPKYWELSGGNVYFGSDPFLFRNHGMQTAIWEWIY